MFRRGLCVEALKQFVYSQGSSNRETLQSMDKLWSINRSVIDRQIKRFTAIKADERVKVILTNGPKETEYRSALWCKPNPSLGEKVKIYTNEIFIEHGDAKELNLNEEFTLMDWGNCIVKNIVKEGDRIKELVCDLHVEGDHTTTKWKLTWIPNVDDLVPVDIYVYSYLITKPKLEKTDDLMTYKNSEIVRVIKFLGDPALRLLPQGESIQLERRGYFICDKPYIGFDGKPLKLIQIPEGKVSSSHQTSHLTL